MDMVRRALPLPADVDAAVWITDARSFVDGPPAAEVPDVEGAVAVPDGEPDAAAPDETDDRVDTAAGLLVHADAAKTRTTGTTVNERRMSGDPLKICAAPR
jgi:hypothetical protein